jgi:hypothetical protein
LKIPITYTFVFLYFVLNMAPSAVSLEGGNAAAKVEGKTEKIVHVHGAEDLTPLQAISHGPFALSGE